MRWVGSGSRFVPSVPEMFDTAVGSIESINAPSLTQLVCIASKDGSDSLHDTVSARQSFTKAWHVGLVR